MPFVQRSSNFKFFSIKEHDNLGTHNVSVALWRSAGRVTSVICALPVNLQEEIMALFRTVYRIMQHYAPLTDLEWDTDLILLTGGTIIPSYHSRPAGKDVLRFIAKPLCGAQGNTVKSCESFATCSDSCTNRASKREQLFYVRTMVYSMMVTNFFSCQPLPSGPAHPGSNTRFYGVPLHDPKGRAEFESQEAHFLAKARTELQTRFSTTHPVAKPIGFLDFFRWPWQDAAALAAHANECLTMIRDHFQPALPPLPQPVEHFVQIKLKLLAEMRAGRLPCNLLVTPAPSVTLAEIRDLQWLLGGGGGGGWFCPIWILVGPESASWCGPKPISGKVW